MIAEERLDLLALIHPEQPVIDKDAGELIADRFVDQDSGNRAIDPARQSADDFAVTHLRFDLGHFGFAVSGHGPIARQPANAVDEIGEQLPAIGCVHDFGVELGAVKLACFIGDYSKRRAL